MRPHTLRRDRGAVAALTLSMSGRIVVVRNFTRSGERGQRQVAGPPQGPESLPLHRQNARVLTSREPRPSYGAGALGTNVRC